MKIVVVQIVQIDEELCFIIVGLQIMWSIVELNHFEIKAVFMTQQTDSQLLISNECVCDITNR